MKRRNFIIAVGATSVAAALAVKAQSARPYRIGVILQGGLYHGAIDGLRDGLRELGFAEGKNYVLDARDMKGELAEVEDAARSLEEEKVDLIYALATSVTLAVMQATKNVPIVFYAGSDPVEYGLVNSLSKPGGRLTGIHGRFSDLAAKRLQLLREMIPTSHRFLTFYNPRNPAARESIKAGREAARQLNVILVEREIGSVEELRATLQALRPGEADAFYYVADAMMASQSEIIIEAASAKKLPTMFADRESAHKGALACYGASYFELGRLSARHIQRILLGASPAGLPVEQFDRLQFVINLKTAKSLGITIPDSIIVRADEVIE